MNDFGIGDSIVLKLEIVDEGGSEGFICEASGRLSTTTEYAFVGLSVVLKRRWCLLARSAWLVLPHTAIGEQAGPPPVIFPRRAAAEGRRRCRGEVGSGRNEVKTWVFAAELLEAGAFGAGAERSTHRGGLG